MNSKHKNSEAQGGALQSTTMKPQLFKFFPFAAITVAILLAWLCISPISQANENNTSVHKSSAQKSMPKASAEKHSCCSSKDSSAKSDINGLKLAAESKKDSKDSTDKKDAKASAEVAERKPVLDPAQFPGMAAFGYASAKAAPEVMEKLFCYCGCDVTDSHTSLLDCFTSAHGVDCHICQEEAVLGLKLHKDGLSMKEIQQTIDDKYSKQYPFEEPTATYKKYKATRLYATGDGGTAGDTSDNSKNNGSFGKEAAGPDPGDSTKPAASAKKPKLKPGRQPSKCCSAGHDDHDKKSDAKK